MTCQMENKLKIKDLHIDAFMPDQASCSAQTFPLFWAQPLPRTSWLLFKTSILFFSLISSQWASISQLGAFCHARMKIHTAPPQTKLRKWNLTSSLPTQGRHPCLLTKGALWNLDCPHLSLFLKGICVPKMNMLDTRNRAPKQVSINNPIWGDSFAGEGKPCQHCGGTPVNHWPHFIQHQLNWVS